VAGSCGTIDRIGANGRWRVREEAVVVYGKMTGGFGVRFGMRAEGAGDRDAGEETMVISCSVLENNAQNFHGDK